MNGLESIWTVIRTGDQPELWRVYTPGTISQFLRDGDDEDLTPRDVAERFVRESEEDGGRPGTFVVVEYVPAAATR